MLTRFPDWPARLTAAVEARRAEAAAWGRNDCAIFACDCVRAMTGVDMAAAFRGTYRCAFGARRRLREEAAGGLERLAEQTAARLGIAEIPPVTASVGDLLLADTVDGATLGVCLGSRAASAGATGLALWPVAAARRAWRI